MDSNLPTRLNSSFAQSSNMSINSRPMQAMGGLSSINPGLRPTNQPLSTAYLNIPTPMGGVVPSVPPRRPITSPYNRMASMNPYFGSRMSPFGYGQPYGGYSQPYGSYSRMSHYGAGGDSYNSFIQMAEESTRPAFQSIESVVEVVSSISMMLESTYQAVYSSYGAILGVVDQFSRLKDHLAQIFSILALLRGLRWLCLKVLYLLGVRKENPSAEAAWASAELNGVSQQINAAESQKSAWPFLMFISLVIGAPWLMFKLLSKSVSKKQALNPSSFLTAKGSYMMVTAAYNYTAARNDELTFMAGDKLLISPQRPNIKGWVLACNSKKETGLIPSTYMICANCPNTGKYLVSVEYIPSNTPNPVLTDYTKNVSETKCKEVFEEASHAAPELTSTIPSDSFKSSSSPDSTTVKQSN